MKLIGLEELKKQMSEIMKKADIYRKGGVQVPHIVMNLPHDNGQSMVADYITSILYENKLRKFCGLDILLEYKPDGTLSQMKKIFEDITSKAVYTNEYEGVVAVDISSLPDFINEYQIDYFVEHIGMVAQNATMIIYYDASLGGRMDLIKKRVVQAIGSYVEVPVPPYSKAEYSKIITQNIKERGIEIEAEEEFETLIGGMVDKYHVNNVKQAVAMAEDLIYFVEYGDIPKIDAKMVSEH